MLCFLLQRTNPPETRLIDATRRRHEQRTTLPAHPFRAGIDSHCRRLGNTQFDRRHAGSQHARFRLQGQVVLCQSKTRNRVRTAKLSVGGYHSAAARYRRDLYPGGYRARHHRCLWSRRMQKRHHNFRRLFRGWPAWQSSGTHRAGECASPRHAPDRSQLLGADAPRQPAQPDLCQRQCEPRHDRPHFPVRRTLYCNSRLGIAEQGRILECGLARFGK